MRQISLSKFFLSFCFLFILLVSQHEILAQVGINTNAPHFSSVLDISSTNSGLLMPRMTRTQRLTISMPGNIVPNGLLVYQTDDATASEPAGIYFYNNLKWYRLNNYSNSIGDIKYSALTTDHDGWYLCNGRSRNSFPLSVRNVLDGLGFPIGVPEYRNLFLKQKSALATSGGFNQIKINRENMPNYTLYNGNSSAAGSHNHASTNNVVSQWYHLHTVNGQGFPTIYIQFDVNNIQKVARATLGSSSYEPDHTHTISNMTPSLAHSHGLRDLYYNQGSWAGVMDVTNANLTTNVFIFLGY